jgi:hypothetical protein
MNHPQMNHNLQDCAVDLKAFLPPAFCRKERELVTKQIALRQDRAYPPRRKFRKSAGLEKAC